MQTKEVILLIVRQTQGQRQGQPEGILKKLKGREWQQRIKRCPNFCALKLDATKKQWKMASACVMSMGNARGVVILTAITWTEKGVFVWDMAQQRKHAQHLDATKTLWRVVFALHMVPSVHAWSWDVTEVCSRKRSVGITTDALWDLNGTQVSPQ